MVLLNGPIIVDTFFNISGFLACYLLLSEFYKAEKNVKFVMLYIHRFLRLKLTIALKKHSEMFHFQTYTGICSSFSLLLHTFRKIR